MSILFVFLSAIMFLDSILLILLVLVQQPKKDSGAGMAFGGSTADALFGAGSGNALTTITKYSAGLFFALAILMAVITAHRGKPSGSALEDALTKSGGSSGVMPPPTNSARPGIFDAPGTNAATPTSSNSPAPMLTPASSNSAVPPATVPATNK